MSFLALMNNKTNFHSWSNLIEREIMGTKMLLSILYFEEQANHTVLLWKEVQDTTSFPLRRPPYI